MADPFVAEIRIFPFNFAPTGWAFCDGQLLPISQNTALFSLLGTTYGGNGKSNFALPDMQGNAPMHPGQGQGLSLRDLGEIGGSQFVTLIQSEMPVHTHAMQGQNSNSNLNDPATAVLARPFGGGNLYKTPSGATVVNMAPQTISPAGGSLPHNNMMPYLTLNFCIAMQGVFPARP
ncbi:phage tail protein [Tahibacter amnicola]|uniref:Tail fiber protein n=1 Tax=Tahibacter amnicola TaxID=2976241 RepID=A0ABY6BID9_9GAMM|nr:tail fiber protein [Tahibacter amnicola]UXI69277.1 tail fiber protein [Tahibacter amnicola]